MLNTKERIKQKTKIAACVSKKNLSNAFEEIENEISELHKRFLTNDFKVDTPEETRIKITKLIDAKMVLLKAIDCANINEEKEIESFLEENY